MTKISKLENNEQRLSLATITLSDNGLNLSIRWQKMAEYILKSISNYKLSTRGPIHNQKQTVKGKKKISFKF